MGDDVVLKFLEKPIMMKTLFATALLGLALAAPAYADEMAKCDDATMMKIKTDVGMMKDPAMKPHMEMAMKEMDMAAMAMKDHKMDDCSMHLTEAMKQSMMK